MNRINRKIEYALMALKYMSQKIPGELTTAKEVTSHFSAPFDATARVMQIMAQRGLLRSEQGVFGGYQINRDLSKVSLLDLMEIIEGSPAIAKCMQKDSTPCEIQNSCNIITPVTLLNQKISNFYDGINLKDLLIEAANKNSITKELSHG